MLITKDNFKKFNNKHKVMIEKLNFDASPLKLNGSYPITLWASDIDFYKKVNIKDLENLLKYLLNGIMKKNKDNVSFVKLKVGDKKIRNYNDAIKIIHNVKKTKLLLQNSNMGTRASLMKWLKLDFHLYNGIYIEDISIIYDFSDKNINLNFEELIKNDIKYYLNNKQYYKVLKRLRSLEPNNKQLLSILNDSHPGFIYLTLNRIKALQDSKFNKDIKNNVLSNIKEDIIIKIGAHYPILRNLDNIKIINLNTIYKKLNHLLNNYILSIKNIDFNKI